jgi:formylmethanofuran dehydrogenase subunit D
MGLSARSVRADQVPMEPGSYWCERLTGTHTSSDCLVQDGEPRWFAHTRGSDLKDASRPVYWAIGVELPQIEAWVGDWVRRNLAGYTGICNIELIGGKPIEAHLRGSNGFFDLYGPDFLPAWVALVDEPLAPVSASSDRHLVVAWSDQSPYQFQAERRGIGYPNALVVLHPSDAAQRGISNGDEVMVSTRRGSVRFTARVTDRIKPGVAHCAHGWNHANINELTDDSALDPISGFPPFKSLLCEVEPARDEARKAA